MAVESFDPTAALNPQALLQQLQQLMAGAQRQLEVIQQANAGQASLAAALDHLAGAINHLADVLSARPPAEAGSSSAGET